MTMYMNIILDPWRPFILFIFFFGGRGGQNWAKTNIANLLSMGFPILVRPYLKNNCLGTFLGSRPFRVIFSPWQISGQGRMWVERATNGGLKLRNISQNFSTLFQYDPQ